MFANLSDAVSRQGNSQRLTIRHLGRMKAEGRKITMLTAYDYTFASIVDQAGVDVVLVGDSLGMVMLGYDSTLPVTMEDVLHHTRAVARGTQRALVVADMPFGSYQASVEDAMRNAARFLKEAQAHAIKLEGGQSVLPQVRALTAAGIPVMGHLGLTPQSVHQMGGYRVQGRSDAQAQQILQDARALEEAGAFGIVAECMPHELGSEMAKAVGIPVIGIGAGAGCDGQVLVLQDMLGLYKDISPRFVKRYADLHGATSIAIKSYVDEVRSGAFPTLEHSFTAST